MTKISSAWTPFFKRVFPAIWFGFIALFLVTALMADTLQKDAFFLGVPIVMAIFGYFLMKKLVWVLADEVYDCGEYLLVKNAGEEEKVYLSNVMNVSTTTLLNPPQVTLRLISPGKSGSEVTFSPAMGFRFNPFARSQVAEDLMVRPHRARAGHAV